MADLGEGPPLNILGEKGEITQGEKADRTSKTNPPPPPPPLAQGLHLPLLHLCMFKDKAAGLQEPSSLGHPTK